MLRFAGPASSFLCVCLALGTPVRAAEPRTTPRPLPTKGEAKILAALAEPTAVDFIENPLSDAIDFLKQKHEIEIQLDTKALTDAGIGTDTPMTAQLGGITLRSLLRLMLGQLDLTYVIRDGYLVITSKTEAENMLRIKVYPVADLVTLDSEFRPPLPAGQNAGEDYSSLINLITSTVAPTTWDEVGGPGSIQSYRSSRSITCAQTEEAHEEVAELLAALRRVRDKQLAAAHAAPQVDQPKRRANAEGLRTKVYHLLRTASRVASIGNSGNGMGGGAIGGTFMVADDAASGEAPKTPKSSPGMGPGDTDSSTSKQKKTAKPTPATSGAEPDARQLDEWAKELADLLPELVEPKGWEPKGTGSVQAVAGTIIVRQTPQMQESVAELLGEIFPGRVAVRESPKTLSVRLSAPGPQVDWPQEAEPQLAANEARIYAALGNKCDLDVSEARLEHVIAMLAEKEHATIWIDQKALTDAGVANDTPVTCYLHGLNLRTVLRHVLGELDLTYVVRNEVLAITSKTEAENMLTTKVYPVFDLLDTSSELPSASRLEVLGLPHSSAHARPNFAALIENITSSIPPTTWDEVGGPGAIQGFVNSGALVISQTTEVHEEIAEYLRALREVAVAQR